jgi:hypothetical protein
VVKFDYIRFLGNGDSISTLCQCYRTGKSTMDIIVKDTLAVIWDKLSPIYMKLPSSEAEWSDLSKKFECVWGLPNCIGE